MSEVLASDGALAAHYEYAPFGAMIYFATSTIDIKDRSEVENPFT